MAHRTVSLAALGEAAEVVMALAHLFDHASARRTHAHDYQPVGDPQFYRGRLWLVESCPCGTVRRTLHVFNAKQGCYRRIYRGIEH